MADDTASVPVTIRVLGIERAPGRRRLLAFVIAEIEISDVTILIQGLQLRRNQFAKMVLLPPQIQTANGALRPAVVLPDAVLNGIFQELGELANNVQMAGAA